MIGVKLGPSTSLGSDLNWFVECNSAPKNLFSGACDEWLGKGIQPVYVDNGFPHRPQCAATSNLKTHWWNTMMRRPQLI